MSLKDRNARAENRKDRTNMTAKENMFDMNVIRGMVPADSARGAVPKEEGVNVNELRGLVSVPWPSYGDDPVDDTPRCRATTKKGEPCKASPIVGEELCVGHQRQLDAAGVN